ncbi:MAG: hypothetical protein WC523_04105 [Patescibacteria group bacterium]
MSLLAKILLAFGAVVVLIGIIIGGSLISTNNELVAQEQGLQAQYDQNRNSYDNGFKKIKEVASVSEIYSGDLKKVYDSAIQGRYGKDGSRAMFQWLKESNPNLDSSIYRQIQQVIESVRNDFESNQKTLLDKKRVYLTLLKRFPTNIVAGILGFPKIDLKNIDIVTSEETENAFGVKKAEPIRLR